MTKTIKPLLIIRLCLIERISEWTNSFKKSMPENVKILRSNANKEMKKSSGLKIDSNLNIRKYPDINT